MMHRSAASGPNCAKDISQEISKTQYRSKGIKLFQLGSFRSHSIIWYIGVCLWQKKLHRVHPMCNPPMCNIVPNVQHFLRNLCFASCPQCATVRKNFNSKMTKMNGNGLNMVFKVIKLTSKAVFYHLYQNILPLFTIYWPLFLKMDKKSLFFIKNFISIFSGQCPQCATLFWGV